MTTKLEQTTPTTVHADALIAQLSQIAAHLAQLAAAIDALPDQVADGVAKRLELQAHQVADQVAQQMAELNLTPSYVRQDEDGRGLRRPARPTPEEVARIRRQQAALQQASRRPVRDAVEVVDAVFESDPEPPVAGEPSRGLRRRR